MSPLLRPAHGTRASGVKLNILERAEDGPELAEEVAVVSDVVLANHGHDSLGGLISLVEGNATGTGLACEICWGRSRILTGRGGG